MSMEMLAIPMVVTRLEEPVDGYTWIAYVSTPTGGRSGPAGFGLDKREAVRDLMIEIQDMLATWDIHFGNGEEETVH